MYLNVRTSFQTNPTQLKFSFAIHTITKRKRKRKKERLERIKIIIWHHWVSFREITEMTGPCFVKLCIWTYIPSFLFFMTFWCSQGMYTDLLQKKLLLSFITSNLSELLFIWFMECIPEDTQRCVHNMAKSNQTKENQDFLLLQSYFSTLCCINYCLLYLWNEHECYWVSRHLQCNSYAGRSENLSANSVL